MQSWSMLDSEISSNGRGTLAATKERTLVVYIYDRSDPVYQNNLNYFLKRGISSGDGCDYIFIVQNADNPQVNFAALSCFNALPVFVSVCRMQLSETINCPVLPYI